MSKSGMSAIPILPQNMLATKEDNPRKFYGQCCYLVAWLLLVILFIIYAAFTLSDYLDDQDNPVITLSISNEEKLFYPVFVVCPFSALAFHNNEEEDFGFPYYHYGLQVDAGDLIDSNPSYVLIDASGGAKKKKKSEDQNDNKNNDMDKKKQEISDGLYLGNTGSLFPARRDPCASEKELTKDFLQSKKDIREKEFAQQTKMIQNYYFMAFRSLSPVLTRERGELNGNLIIEAGYYPCIVFNSDRRVTKEDRERLLDLKPFVKTDSKCNPGDVSSLSSSTANEPNKKGKKDEKDDSPRAYALSTGFFDGYVMEIYTRWKYSDELSEGKKGEERVSGLPDEYSITSLSITIADTLDEIEATAAEYAGISLPIGTVSALFLKRISFKCVDCDDGDEVIFYNTTLSLLDLTGVPQVPCRDTNRPGKPCRELKVKTQINVFFEAMITTKQEEVIIQGPLDYLGNFAGMLGTLLAFSVLGAIDRLCAYVFIGNGAMASVWDDVQG